MLITDFRGLFFISLLNDETLPKILNDND